MALVVEGRRPRQRGAGAYFGPVPWDTLPAGAEGFTPPALDVARRNLSREANCELHLASVEAIPLPDGAMDFGYSVGVLHHVPDTAPAGLLACTAKLKPGAPFLVYLYYAFDNRPRWVRALWRLSDAGRFIISRLPRLVRTALTDAIAAFIYWPLARAARLLDRLGFSVASFPLSAYRERSFYTMRTDALDRFGTRLEKRFTREDVGRLMAAAGLRDIRFSEREPFWCAVGIKR